MKALIVGVLLGGVAIAHADDDPLAVLKDEKRTWAFEIVSGPSIAKLTPVKHIGNVTSVCNVAEVKTFGAITRATFSCKTDSDDTAVFKVASRATPYLHLAFDADGVRQVYSYDTEAIMADKTNVAGFTFPRALVKGRWTTEAANESRRVKISVKETKMRIAGKNEKVWLSDVKVWDAKSNVLTRDDAAAFLPGVGLGLVCSHDVDKDARKPAWMCVRLIESSVAP